MQRQTLTVAEAAVLLGISRNSAYKGVSAGVIPSIRVGRRVLVCLPALSRLLEREGKSDALRETDARRTGLQFHQ